MGAVFLQIVQLSLIFYNGLLLLLLCGLSFNRIEMQGEKQQTVIGLLLHCQSTVALSQIHIEKFGHMSEQNNLISKHILRNICCNCKKWSKGNVFLLVSSWVVKVFVFLHLSSPQAFQNPQRKSILDSKSCFIGYILSFHI